MKRTYTEFNIIPAGTKIVFFANAGMAGTDHAEGYILRSDMTEGYLDNEAWRFGVECAEHYGIYPSHEYEDEDDYDEDDEDDECYYDGIEGYWDIYNAEEHGGEISFSKVEPSFREI